MNDLILYTTEDGRSQIKLRAKEQTVWLTQREMAQLFDVSTDNVGLHLKNIFLDGELEEKSVTEDSSVTAADGKNYLTKLYQLDAILAVGYRVRSPRGVQFRRWASTVLKEYLVQRSEAQVDIGGVHDRAATEVLHLQVEVVRAGARLDDFLDEKRAQVAPWVFHGGEVREKMGEGT